MSKQAARACQNTYPTAVSSHLDGSVVGGLQQVNELEGLSVTKYSLFNSKGKKIKLKG